MFFCTLSSNVMNDVIICSKNKMYVQIKNINKNVNFIWNTEKKLKDKESFAGESI